METSSGKRKNPSSTAGRDAPRTDCLEWDEYFMGVAFLSGMRSQDPSTQVGACIVNEENRIVGTGYNGMPDPCEGKDLHWGKSDTWLYSKYPYVCHAELNAVLNKNAATLKGCKIYVSLFPCNECAKLIIQSGISEVIYYSDKHSGQEKTKASRKMLQMAGVTCRQFFPKKSEILIDFTSIDTVVQQQHNKEGQGGAATPPDTAQEGAK